MSVSWPLRRPYAHWDVLFRHAPLRIDHIVPGKRPSGRPGWTIRLSTWGRWPPLKRHSPFLVIQWRTFDTLAVLPPGGLGPPPGSRFRQRVAASRREAGPFLVSLEAYADDTRDGVSLHAAFALKESSFLGFYRVISYADGWCPFGERSKWLGRFTSILTSVAVRKAGQAK